MKRVGGWEKIMGNLKSRRIKKMKKKMDGGKLMNHEVQRIVEMRADCSLKRVE